MDTRAEIARLERELKALKEASRERPDEDSSICFVIIRKSKDGGPEYFDRSTVSSTLSGCHFKYAELELPEWANEEPVVRVAKVRLVEVGVVK